MKLYNATFDEIISVFQESAMPNPFCHVELNTTDVKKAKEFYGGGMMKNPIPGAPSFWLSYVLVDDIQAATKKAKSLGGTVMKDVTAVPNVGEFSVITDPTGAHFALWKPKSK
jgi:predicted enzyme related to lactoylglutathione lyase